MSEEVQVPEMWYDPKLEETWEKYEPTGLYFCYSRIDEPAIEAPPEGSIRLVPEKDEREYRNQVQEILNGYATGVYKDKLEAFDAIRKLS